MSARNAAIVAAPVQAGSRRLALLHILFDTIPFKAPLLNLADRVPQIWLNTGLVFSPNGTS